MDEKEMTRQQLLQELEALRRRASDPEGEAREHGSTGEILRRIRRAMGLLRAGNEAMLRAESEHEYLHEMCRIIVETGGYRMAWVGLAVEGEEKNVLPAAHAGFEDGYLESVDITWDDTERGRGPTGTAIRTRRPVINKNVLTDPAFAPWREEAEKRGYASSIALPMVAGGEIFGALNIYAAEPDAFDEEEAHLLEELGRDMAHTMRSIQAREDAGTAEGQLQESREMFHEFMDRSPLVAYLKDEAGRYVYMNRQFERLFDLELSQWVGRSVDDLFPKDTAGQLRESDEKVLREGKTVRKVVKIPVDGAERFYMSLKFPFVSPTGRRYLGGVSVDVTEQQETERKLRESLEGTIRAMAKVVEMRDPYTAGHQQRVARLAEAIAVEMGLAQDSRECIRLAGTIHDIGKIRVPAEILSKPGRLTSSEFEIIQTHSQVGYDILSVVDFPWPIADIVLQHHERMDGSGYPNGLKGEKLLMEARILGVADVVEAMSSHRPHRPALGLDVALEEISKKKGTLFDESVVEACLRVFREKGFEWE
jgi:PAS domain S-box-containing protein/putative nucleotidyltransferase with HDIG domain